MSATQHTPVVPLEAGAGPDNPPCPACGEPLFGWLAVQPGLAGPVRRCESCGLGVVGDDAGPEEALRELSRLGGEEAQIHNRAGFACSIGGAGWAGLLPGGRYLFTVEAVRRLVARRDQVVASRRWAGGASIAATWQTFLNSVTFGHNVALGALSGREHAVPAAKPWQRRIDALASTVLAIPALLLALPVELLAAPLGRGAVLHLRLQLL